MSRTVVLLTLAELSVLLGIFAAYWFGSFDFSAAMVAWQISIVAFLVPMLLAFRDERKAEESSNG